MANGADGMHIEHARPSITHHCANLFAHFCFVAMHAAVGAEGFRFHEGAVIDAIAGVARQCCAFVAKLAFGRVVIVTTVNRDHFTDDVFFVCTLTGEIRHGSASFVENGMF